MNISNIENLFVYESEIKCSFRKIQSAKGMVSVSDEFDIFSSSIDEYVLISISIFGV